MAVVHASTCASAPKILSLGVGLVKAFNTFLH